ncbi:MAG: metalloregulator ArsR/SmtB family transcription factor [Proteobacteria bacterium]|nr:winged helix-turn-helix transcriptional regulator [Desulfobacterales bacterium]MBL6968253.1 winged helix-turn-helix transcriptional regulator [Desulfobacteraceae bacterium]MBU0734519.1 metalloregulator ArsR/SmtB family transcription factor [Pseudomonadota bacterium]MBL7101553.1 winged helix-turn-helix transcriptional regulator [Desulfobacteraceae bacterium]MBL7173615.1 winged helix-turn-helix transcriptional regulator [Desulfobacteraceae bacterium]
MGFRRATLLEKDGCRVRVVHLERVAKANRDAVRESELDRLAQAFKALGDPTRLKIVMALLGGEMCVCDLSAFLRLSESAVSHQLRRLKDLGLVRNRRDGQILYYALDDEHVTGLLSLGLDHARE